MFIRTVSVFISVGCVSASERVRYYSVSVTTSVVYAYEVCVRACVRVCVRACVRVCVRACVCVCECSAGVCQNSSET